MPFALGGGLLGLLLLLSTASCGEVVVPGTGGEGGENAIRYRSGSRLKVVVRRAATAETPVGVFDSALGLRCNVGVATDARLRCVPESDGFIVYTDPACASPIVSPWTGSCGAAEAPSAVIEPVLQAGCTPSMSRVFAVGGPIAKPTGSYYTRQPDGSCVEGGLFTSGIATFALGAEIQASELAPIVVVEAARGDDLTVRYHTSDDGFRMLDFYPYDRRHGTACVPQAQGVCAPDGTLSPQLFADATCSGEPGLFTFSPGCPRPTAGTLTTYDGERHDRFFEVGAEVTAHTRSADGATCIEVTDADQIYAALGREIPASELPRVERVDEGTGPMRVRTFDAAGAPITWFGDFVTDGGVYCDLSRFSDGKRRCTTEAFATLSGRFADSKCSEPAAVLDAGCHDRPIPRLVVEVVAGAGCGSESTRRVYERGDEVTGAVYARDSGGACAAAPGDCARYFRVGAPVPDERFIEVTEALLE